MEIIIKKTTELIQEEWETYIHSFNKVFHKTLDVNHFKHKYFNTIDGFSYHSLLKEDKSVVGSCTIIPYEYYIESKTIRVGLAVDVFISEDYREDPYSLFRMYKKVKKDLLLNDISLVIAVPNDTAYPYWKKVVKWKDIGMLSYHIFPVKIGNVVRKLPKVSNLVSKLFIKFLLFTSQFHNSKEKYSKIRIDRSDPIVEIQRYITVHKKIAVKEAFFSYRIINEHGVNTCYLIDFYNLISKKRSSAALREAISYIMRTEEVDLIIHVGSLLFKQFLLLRLPRKFEPKHLYLITDIFSTKDSCSEELILNISNWDFGLFNYDVR